jgi:acyl transferase domain-containing protein/acyl carrier protein
MSDARRNGHLRDWLVRCVATATGMPLAEIDTGEPFAGHGIDSMKLAALAAEVELHVGRRLPATALFEFPTIDALAAYLSSPGAGETLGGDRGESGGAIAIVGLACRMPGAADAESFWRLLDSAADAVGDVSADRWDAAEWYDPDPAVPGRTISRWGGFLDDVAGFDAAFFRIAAAEAVRMDPQQRLLLETCWEAFEDAGELPARLRGSAAGVFIGISTSEYFGRLLADRNAITPHALTGNALAVAANRLSYVFDLRGPSVAVDTACSSSLVAVHLACRALRAGECDRAVAGGVNLLLDPELSIGLSKAGMLSPDGRCKAFDARANGYVRGEGCGVVVLKPLSAALKAGDRVYAVIRGSAVNQDGGSNGLTAPNPAAQRDVVRAACRDAAIDPGRIEYVECHGTGTQLGDPIEAQSLGAVIGARRPPGQPCLIGSVKTNVGHLESAAGIAGLIKAALALHHGRIPASLHFERPNTHIDFAGLGLRVADRGAELDRSGEPHAAGVSSFGFGGTNAHVVVESVLSRDAVPAPARPIVLSVSARSIGALERRARAFATRLAGAPNEEVRALAYTASVRRTHHRPFRAAVAADVPAALAERVRELAETLGAAGARRAMEAPRIAFAFGGQGAQWPAMGRRLLDEDALFASTIRRCDAVLRDELGWSVEAVLRGRDGRDIRASSVAEPLIVAFQLGLAEVWRALGVEPVAVVGHSLGEISAAVVAGVIDVETGLRLAARRGELMHHGGGAGRMLAIGLDRRGADELCARFPAKVSLAAVNAPRSTVLSGDPEALDGIRKELAAAGIFARPLPVPYAFHSPAMQVAADAFAAELGELAGRAARIPIVSTVLGREVAGEQMDAAYWGSGVRRTVEFAAAAEALLARQVDAIVEISPQPVLRSGISQIVRERDRAVAVLHSVDRERGGLRTVLDGACRLYALGTAVRWEHAFPDGGTVASVPTHPWEHRSYWTARTAGRRGWWGGDGGLLGTRLDLAGDDGRFVWECSVGGLAWLLDHRLNGAAVLPASAFVALAAEAAAAAGLTVPLEVAELTLRAPLLTGEDGTIIQTTLVRDGEGGYGFSVHRRSAAAPGWLLHATARVAAAGDERPVPLDVAGAELRCIEPVAPVPLYALLAERGFGYGPAFRGLQTIWRADGEALAEIDVSGNGETTGGEDIRALDCALQAIAAAVGSLHEAGRAVPAAFGTIRWGARPGPAAKAYVRLRELGSPHLLADVTVYGADGSPCVEIAGLELRGAGRSLIPATASLHLYETHWRERPVPAGDTVLGRWLVLEDRDGVGAGLRAELERRGAATVTWPAGLDRSRPADYQRLVDELAHEPQALAGVVDVWGCDRLGPDAAGEPGALTRPAESLLNLVRALSTAPGVSLPKLVVAGRGGQGPDGAGASLDHVVQATRGGLLKALPIENPLLRYACVDLEPGDPHAAARLADEVLAGAPDPEVAYRGGRRFVPRLGDARDVANASHPDPPVRADGTYVVSGGTGGLGLLLARRLAERGAGSIVLLSRRGEPPEARAVLDALRARAPGVRAVAADVRDRAALLRALDAARAAGPPIRGIVHAAGVLRDGALLDMSAESLRAVLEPKLLGGWNLHELTLTDPIEWFVLFSSAAGVLGSPGQANYSAANAALDALARARRELGLPALSIAWGPWAEAGMAACGAESDELRKLRTGASAIEPEAGLEIFERLLRDERAEAMVLPFDLRDLLQFYPAGPRLAFFEEIAGGAGALAGTAAHSSARPSLSGEFVPPRGDVEQRIATIWQRALAIEPIGVFDSFFELGGDSVFGNQILIEINRTLGVKIDPERAFANLTVAHLAALAEEHAVAQLGALTETEARHKLASLRVLAESRYSDR